MPAAAVSLLDSFSALAEETRCRMLWLLEQHELTVGELCGVLQLPQSTVSRHLKTLAEAGWVTSRRDGTSRYYALSLDGADGAHRRIWELTREQLAGRPGLDQDDKRLARVLSRRSETSKKFFASSAAEWDRVRHDLFGDDFSIRALAGLLPSDWVVGDLGCGTGVTTAALAPFVRQVIGIDGSDEMLDAARTRLSEARNVELRKGALESLPIDSGMLDAATLVLVLHHLASPATALSETARVLKPGGRALVVDMAPHDHEEYRREMGHVWLGFGEDQMRRLFVQAGFTDVRLHSLPPDTHARGPLLFAATGTRGLAPLAERRA